MGNAGCGVVQACCSDVSRADRIPYEMQQEALSNTMPKTLPEQLPETKTSAGATEAPIAVLSSKRESPLEAVQICASAGKAVGSNRESGFEQQETGRMTEDSASTAASSTPSCVPPSDAATAQSVVKQFVRSFVKGRQVTVLVANGGTTDCIATLDRKLTTLSIQRAGKTGSKQRHMPLEQIAEVSVGTDAQSEVELEVDDCCVTLLLHDGQAISFRFEDIESRDTFALCLSMFVDGRRDEMARRRAEARAEHSSK